jgi:CubicO group peptidase (beta-lactamase class C family)
MHLLILSCLGTVAALYAADSQMPAGMPIPVAPPASVGLSTERLERFSQRIKQDVADGKMPGAVVAIARKGKLAYYESFGFVDKAVGTAMPKDAIFALASMTKAMGRGGYADAGRRRQIAAERSSGELSAAVE